MSLLITSSSEGAGDTNQIGISVPYQFRNNLKNPLIIEPLSEIAVESVKLNRMPQIDYEGAMVANLWFGERLAADGLDNSLSYFIPCENTIDEGSSPLDFSEKFKTILQENYSQHPEIDSQNIVVNVLTDTIGGFTGFEFKIPSLGGVAAGSTIPPAATRTQEEDTHGDGILDWDGSLLTADGDNTAGQLQPIQAEGGPLSLNSGSLTYDNRDVDGAYTLGVSRPIGVVDQGDNGVSELPESVDQGILFGTDESDGSGFISGVGKEGTLMMDYCAQDDGDGKVRLFHSVASNSLGFEEPTIVMEEIKYYQKNNGAFAKNNALNSCFATGVPQLSSAISQITFRPNGENMEILFGASIACSALDVNASTKSQVPKPVGQTAWKMYPTVCLWEDEDEVEITRYECRTSTTIYNNQPENSWISRSQIPTILGNGTALDQFTQLTAGVIPTAPWNNATSWGKSVDIRPAYQILDADSQNTSATTLRTRKVISGSLITDYENIFIMGPSERYMPRRIQGWQPNSMEALGFSPFAINVSSNMVSAFGASFRSATRPSMLSQHSTFVRVPTLTHETYNFGTGNPSKILYQVPRFDNAGTETGALFFQNPDKTFIDLKNTSELRITDLDVHMVRKDERFAKDLTGSTEVVFHIRKKQKL
tara:strand:+ start:1816 stop:3768 length:1953 start_codon:yes stop_codon:yes gene_type:complete